MATAGVYKLFIDQSCEELAVLSLFRLTPIGHAQWPIWVPVSPSVTLQINSTESNFNLQSLSYDQQIKNFKASSIYGSNYRGEYNYVVLSILDFIITEKNQASLPLVSYTERFSTSSIFSPDQILLYFFTYCVVNNVFLIQPTTISSQCIHFCWVLTGEHPVPLAISTSCRLVDVGGC